MLTYVSSRQVFRIKKLVKILTYYNYGSLLKEGIRIYEYTPGFVHAKQILTEDAAIVGTINMDYRSYYLHYENGIWMSGEQIQEDIRKDFVLLLRKVMKLVMKNGRTDREDINLSSRC